MKIGRNDPCPCGSGKKYKNCCLENYLESYNYSNDTEIEYEQYSGFRSKSFIRAIKEVVSEEESVCLVTLVRNVEDAIEILKKYVLITDVGEWVVSTGNCDKIKLYGPFQTKDEACRFGEKSFGVKRWVGGLSDKFDGIELG